MTTTATTLKTALLSLVGASLATDGWEDGVLTEALSQGLADLNAWMPPIESSFTVVTPGAEQDLSSLAPQQVLAVATPWTTTSEWRTAAVPWRTTGPGVVMLPESAAADQVIRVRYRKVYTVSGMGAAVATTLPPAAERTLLLAAASHAYLIRYRQLSRRPSTAPSDLASCKELAEVYRRQFEGTVLEGSAQPVAWPKIGL
ncbi:MAG: hypothetical protein U0X20_22120 [Caldilineaceae bacterium]